MLNPQPTHQLHSLFKLSKCPPHQKSIMTLCDPPPRKLPYGVERVISWTAATIYSENVAHHFIVVHLQSRIDLWVYPISKSEWWSIWHLLRCWLVSDLSPWVLFGLMTDWPIWNAPFIITRTTRIWWLPFCSNFRLDAGPLLVQITKF